MTTEKTKITSLVCSDGSFGGLRARRPGGVMTVWFCHRGWRERNGWAQDPCAHASRAEARGCTRTVYPYLQRTVRRQP